MTHLTHRYAMEAGGNGGGGAQYHEVGDGGGRHQGVIGNGGAGAKRTGFVLSEANPYPFLNNQHLPPNNINFSQNSPNVHPNISHHPNNNLHPHPTVAEITASLNNNLFSVGSNDSVYRPPSVTSFNGSVISNGGIGNGLVDRGNGTTSPDGRSGGSISPIGRGSGTSSPNGRSSGTTSPNGRTSGTTSPTGRTSGSTSPNTLAITQSRDRRAERLAVAGLGLTIVALLMTLTAVCTSEWARFAGK